MNLKSFSYLLYHVTVVCCFFSAGSKAEDFSTPLRGVDDEKFEPQEPTKEEVFSTGTIMLWCDPKCDCFLNTDGYQFVDCSKRNLTHIPFLHPRSQIIDLSSNQIQAITGASFKNLTEVLKIDASNNEISYIDTRAFYDCLKLRELKLQYNALTEFPTFFAGKNQLRVLYIQHNSIAQLVPVSLAPLTNLITLDISFNNISQLVPGTFGPGNFKLRQLFMNNNHITQLFEHYFDTLTSLEWLKLSKNRIFQLPNSVFSKLSALQYLEINRNKLTVIGSLAFKGLSNLEVLKLRRNDIHTLKDGAFWGLSRIQHLQLDYNEIASIEREWLYGLGHLEKLSLTNNQISMLKPDTWDTLPNLIELDLSVNLISEIPALTFKDLLQLRQLNLADNHIHRVQIRAFTGLTNLQELDLSQNLIANALNTFDDDSDVINDNDGDTALSNSVGGDMSQSINTDNPEISSDLNREFAKITNPLCSLAGLKVLKLRSNQINLVVLANTTNSCLIRTLGQLVSFDLSGNDIQRFIFDPVAQTSEMSPFKDMKEILINTTSLFCDCDMVTAITAWLQPLFMAQLPSITTGSLNNHYMKAPTLKCLYPPGLNNIDLMDLITYRVYPTSNSAELKATNHTFFSYCDKARQSEGNTPKNMGNRYLEPNAEQDRIVHEALLQNLFYRNDGATKLKNINGNLQQTKETLSNTPLMIGEDIFNEHDRVQVNFTSLESFFIPELPVILRTHSPTRVEFIEGQVGRTLFCEASIDFYSYIRLSASITDPNLDTTTADTTSFDSMRDLQTMKRMLNIKWQKESSEEGTPLTDIPTSKTSAYTVQINHTLNFADAFTPLPPDTTINKVLILPDGTRKHTNIISQQVTLYKYTFIAMSHLAFMPLIAGQPHEGIYRCSAQTQMKALTDPLAAASTNNDDPTLSVSGSKRRDGAGTQVNSPRFKVTVFVSPYFTHARNEHRMMRGRPVGTNYDYYDDDSSYEDNIRESGDANYRDEENNKSTDEINSKHTSILAVKIGGTARLECSAEGKPRPRVAWQKVNVVRNKRGQANYEIADFPAARERRMRVMHPSTDSAFYITQVKRSDAGLYLCKARNRAGIARHSLKLQIMELPYFTKRLEDKDVARGGTGVFECLAGGSPQPSVTWYKDGQEIGPVKTKPLPDDQTVDRSSEYDVSETYDTLEGFNAEEINKGDPIIATTPAALGGAEAITNQRIYFAARGTILIITHARLDDTGVYECVVQNTLGKIGASAKLSVLNPAQPSELFDTGSLETDEWEDKGESNRDADHTLTSQDIIDLLNQMNVPSLPDKNSFKKSNKQVRKPSNRRKTFLDEESDTKSLKEFLEPETAILARPKDAVRIGPSSQLRSSAEAENLQNDASQPHLRGGAGLPKELPVQNGKTQRMNGIMVEVIVLAVVTCAVITSILWVFVIYSARRNRFKRLTSIDIFNAELLLAKGEASTPCDSEKIVRNTQNGLIDQLANKKLSISNGHSKNKKIQLGSGVINSIPEYSHMVVNNESGSSTLSYHQIKEPNHMQHRLNLTAKTEKKKYLPSRYLNFLQSVFRTNNQNTPFTTHGTNVKVKTFARSTLLSRLANKKQRTKDDQNLKAFFSPSKSQSNYDATRNLYFDYICKQNIEPSLTAPPIGTNSLFYQKYKSGKLKLSKFPGQGTKNTSGNNNPDKSGNIYQQPLAVAQGHPQNSYNKNFRRRDLVVTSEGYSLLPYHVNKMGPAKDTSFAQAIHNSGKIKRTSSSFQPNTQEYFKQRQKHMRNLSIREENSLYDVNILQRPYHNLTVHNTTVPINYDNQNFTQQSNLQVHSNATNHGGACLTANVNSSLFSPVKLHTGGSSRTTRSPLTFKTFFPPTSPQFQPLSYDSEMKSQPLQGLTRDFKQKFCGKSRFTLNLDGPKQDVITIDNYHSNKNDVHGRNEHRLKTPESPQLSASTSASINERHRTINAAKIRKRSTISTISDEYDSGLAAPLSSSNPSIGSLATAGENVVMITPFDSPVGKQAYKNIVIVNNITNHRINHSRSSQMP